MAATIASVNPSNFANRYRMTGGGGGVGYSQVGTAVAESALEEEGGLGLTRLEVILTRGNYGMGYGFVPAKFSLTEMREEGWSNTHLMDLLSFAHGRGLHIAEIVRGSSAEEQGLRQWDVIQKVNGQDVLSSTAAEIAMMVKSTEGPLMIEVIRDDGTLMKEAQLVWDHLQDPLQRVRQFFVKHFHVQ